MGMPHDATYVGGSLCVGGGGQYGGCPLSYRDKGPVFHFTLFNLFVLSLFLKQTTRPGQL
jgi:hypothetical protein